MPRVLVVALVLVSVSACSSDATKTSKRPDVDEILHRARAIAVAVSGENIHPDKSAAEGLKCIVDEDPNVTKMAAAIERDQGLTDDEIVSRDVVIALSVCSQDEFEDAVPLIAKADEVSRSTVQDLVDAGIAALDKHGLLN